MPPQKTCASLHKDLQHRTPRHFTMLFPLYLRSLEWSRLQTLLRLARTSVDSKIKHCGTITLVFDLLVLPTPFTALFMMGSQTPSIAISAPSPKRDSEFLKILEESSFITTHHCLHCLSSYVFCILLHLFSGNLTQEGHKKSACLSQANSKLTPFSVAAWGAFKRLFQPVKRLFTPNISQRARSLTATVIYIPNVVI